MEEFKKKKLTEGIDVPEMKLAVENQENFIPMSGTWIFMLIYGRICGFSVKEVGKILISHKSTCSNMFMKNRHKGYVLADIQFLRIGGFEFIFKIEDSYGRPQNESRNESIDNQSNKGKKRSVGLDTK